MKKFLFAVWAIFLGIVTGNAQGNKELTGEIREAIDYAFENVDLQKVPTGILSDYGIETIPLSYYSGRKGISQILPPIYFLSFTMDCTAAWSINVRCTNPYGLNKHFR